MHGYELVKTWVLEGVSPNVIQIMVKAGLIDYKAWDAAIDLANYYDEIEREWSDGLPTATERINQFIADGMSPDQIWQMKINKVHDDFISSVKSGKTDETLKRKYAGLFSDRISDDDVASARECPMEKLVQTKKKMAHCPFHNEKTPSFSIRVNHYHCFGCSASGDSIDFVRKTQGLNFVQAVKYINSL